eukprot:CAMPEP_0170176762 /NCGR_PEP_ID=MMETSP0040_2-20121228/9562_1 /TAXON_ID=641309 /ORGANISM="Lotharella oceanica, Strain CCMP622" /LENGTH=136 /DNA_ID=CAMNT_0010419183 /DNA_START=154 /DNA_END=565 /DNA_ORIENTATION=-
MHDEIRPSIVNPADLIRGLELSTGNAGAATVGRSAAVNDDGQAIEQVKVGALKVLEPLGKGGVEIELAELAGLITNLAGGRVMIEVARLFRVSVVKTPSLSILFHGSETIVDRSAEPLCVLGSAAAAESRIVVTPG